MRIEGASIMIKRTINTTCQRKKMPLQASMRLCLPISGQVQGVALPRRHMPALRNRARGLRKQHRCALALTAGQRYHVKLQSAGNEQVQAVNPPGGTCPGLAFVAETIPIAHKDIIDIGPAA